VFAAQLVWGGWKERSKLQCRGEVMRMVEGVTNQDGAWHLAPRRRRRLAEAYNAGVGEGARDDDVRSAVMVRERVRTSMDGTT